jgi:hypothetical protein
MDVEVEIKVVCVNCDDEHTQLGFVFTSLYATYTDIRLTFNEDELTISKSQMLSDDSMEVVFSSKQEPKMKLRGDVVHIQLGASSNVGGTNKRMLSSIAFTTSLKGDSLGNDSNGVMN